MAAELENFSLSSEFSQFSNNKTAIVSEQPLHNADQHSGCEHSSWGEPIRRHEGKLNKPERLAFCLCVPALDCVFVCNMFLCRRLCERYEI